MATREIYAINQTTGARTYAGYAKFDDQTGRYMGSFGGYGASGRQQNPRNGASLVQNTINVAGARQGARTAAAFRAINRLIRR